ncbi:MAG: hypothetical protein KC731_33315 [Myxococcales bacterium]|nr:hypothetical protein [Myxococcales bacterium]
MTPLSRAFASLAGVASAWLLTSTLGCVPMRGTMPASTWPLDGEAKICTAAERELEVAQWSSRDRVALEAGLARNQPVVVSALGCEVEVLPRCQAPGGYDEVPVTTTRLGSARIVARRDLVDAPLRAASLHGDCALATHVVSGVDVGRSARDEEIRPLRVDLTPLSLDGYDLTGTWSGVVRQPDGPYEIYDAKLSLTQRGSRISGVSRIDSIDGEHWGEMHFEGHLEGNVLYYSDARLIAEQIHPLLEWCYRGGFAIVDPRHQTMLGPWRAGFCMPGTMELSRRAD